VPFTNTSDTPKMPRSYLSLCPPPALLFLALVHAIFSALRYIVAAFSVPSSLPP
jgi:hypothetical protein